MLGGRRGRAARAILESDVEAEAGPEDGRLESGLVGGFLSIALRLPAVSKHRFLRLLWLGVDAGENASDRVI